MKPIRVAVVGAGSFGQNHIRVLRGMADVELRAVVDADPGRAPYPSVEPILGEIDAAIVATPTSTHAAVAGQLLAAGVDVLVEKPIAATAAEGEELADFAERNGRVLQVGHLERFNPAIAAVERALTIPLFFEIHRLSVFTARSLDIDVVLDLMIHDLDIVQSFTGKLPNEIQAAGISVLSAKVDIANVRLSFANGCVANLTASRVSTEKIRKLRLFQPGQYISVDYARQEAVRLSVGDGQIGFESLPAEKGEPLALELASFFQCVRSRSRPRVDGRQATAALRTAEAILAKIKEHTDLVAETLRCRR